MSGFFRGVRIDNGEVVEGWLIDCKRQLAYIIPLKSLAVEVSKSKKHHIRTLELTSFYTVYSESLAMKTGRKDKNEVDIYGSFEVDGKMSRGGDRVLLDNGILNRSGLNWLDDPEIKVEIKTNTHQNSWEHFEMAGTIIGSQWKGGE